jgi:hypothetical protein
MGPIQPYPAGSVPESHCHIHHRGHRVRWGQAKAVGEEGDRVGVGGDGVATGGMTPFFAKYGKNRVQQTPGLSCRTRLGRKTRRYRTRRS